MNLTQVDIPAYNRATGTGNYYPGRFGYSKTANFGKSQPITTFVIHWMDTNLAGCDATFKDPNGVHSAHFGVEDDNVHQYVKLTDTSFNCGNGDLNCQSVAIEHSAQPGRYASDLTYQTSGELIASVAKQLGRHVSDFQFKRHGDIFATQCCGTVDVGRIKQEALAAEASQATAVVASATQPVQVVVASAHVTVPGTTYAPFETNLSPSQTMVPEVERVQKFLIDKGFLSVQDVEPNWGYYGSHTQKAVDAFQKANGIPTASEFGWWWTATRGKANQQLTVTSSITNNA